jgi:hypothetical protein
MAVRIICQNCETQLIVQPSLRGNAGTNQAIKAAIVAGWIVSGNRMICSEDCGARFAADITPLVKRIA